MILDGGSLSFDSFHKIVLKGETVQLSPSAAQKVRSSRAFIEKAVAENKKIYSVNTGFGALSDVAIAPAKMQELQKNLIRSHCCGVGPAHSELESRAILLLRANVLAKGYSGVRVELVETLIEMLNKRVHPVIPQKGSVGASGDLAPLAHLAAVVMGEGEALFDRRRMPGAEALQKAGISPVVLAHKEGIALVNGTQQMTAAGCLLALQAQELIELCDLICTASLEGILGTPRAFTDWLHEARPYAGQKESARKMLSYMQASEIFQSHINCDRVQDPYSFRCAPQVHGSVRDLFGFVSQTLLTEMNSATDNPLIHPETGEILSNGNFHGQPVAFALDILAMGLSELASISERRISKLIDPQFSGLPAFLVKDEGLNSGFMMPQVTAASLVSECKLLTHPASTDSIPTSNEKEDHVSMGPIAARKAQTVLENAQYVLAIELLTACQALDFRRPAKPGKGPRILRDWVRERIKGLDKDRYLASDMEQAKSWFSDGQLISEMKRLGVL